MQEKGFYLVKDEFFEIVNDPYLKFNKGGNRPHYYCFKDKNKDIFWMIPLSTRVDKYQKIILKIEKQGKACNILHIAKLADGRESVFLIQDMFPITEKYIARAYTIGGNPLILKNERLSSVIDGKARKVAAMLKRGVKFMPTQVDVIKILEQL